MAATIHKRPASQKVKLRTNRALVIKQLGTDLYTTRAAMIWELVRNGLSAGMPENSKVWDPAQAATIEMVVKTVGGVPTLYLFDNGSGFTPVHRDRMGNFGGGRKDSDRAGGASLRQIGRIAAFCLNEHCLDLDRSNPEDGVVYYTRTADDIKHHGGRVTQLRMTIEGFVERVAYEVDEHAIDPNDPCLGPFAGRTGSFTVLVIPNFVMTAEEIRAGLPFHLPRLASKQVNVSVNGEKLSGIIADMSRGAISDDGNFAIYLRPSQGTTSDDDASGDVVICDADSSCYVTTVRSCGLRHIPPELRNSGITGIVLYRNLFGQTTTSRSALSSSFWSSVEGKRLANHLNSSRVVNLVKALLGDKILFDRQEQGIMREVYDSFKEAFGEVRGGSDIDTIDTDDGLEDTKGDKTPVEKPDDHDPKPRPPKPGVTDPKPKPKRGTRLLRHIGDQVYIFIKMPNDRLPFVARMLEGTTTAVVVDGMKQNVHTIELNTDHAARRELPSRAWFNLVTSEILRAAAFRTNRPAFACQEAYMRTYLAFHKKIRQPV